MIGRPHVRPGRFTPVRHDDPIGVELTVKPGALQDGDGSRRRALESPPGQRSASPRVHPSDATLLARLGASDEGALDALLDRYWSPVFLYALRMTGSRDAADDIAQSVFCRIWERRATWRTEGSVRALLLRLARNIAVSAHRRERAQDRAARGFAETVSMSTFPTLVAERSELRAALERAVADLPARRREVFLLRMLDDLSYDEIAHVMGTSKQTVANQLSRALATLRESLQHLLDQSPI